MPAHEFNTATDDAAIKYRALDTTAAGLTVFHTRLGPSVIDAYGGPEQPATQPIAAALLDLAATDGYAARDLLTHPGCRNTATTRHITTLTRLIDDCGLDSGAIPAPILADLRHALNTAQQVINADPTGGPHPTTHTAAGTVTAPAQDHRIHPVTSLTAKQ